uniref:U47-Theraphotoxin-Sfo1d_1 n=1 Tax=Selenotholus foelschei TaxID=1905327 RepID=A0A482ZA66_9ARAC
MKLSIIIIACFLVASVAGRMRKIKGNELDRNMLLQKLGQDMNIDFEETPRACSKKAGETCTSNCDCCGYSTVCGDITVGGKVVYQCMSKTSDNTALNTVGLGWNSVKMRFRLLPLKTITD